LLFIRDLGLATIRGLTSTLRSASAVALASAVAVALAAGVLAAGAQASPSLTWTGPAPMPAGVTATAVSCASEALCVAVDAQGDALTTLDPTASGPSWNEAEIDHGKAAFAGAPLNSVSCAPEGLCAAVDEHGDVFVDGAPGSSSWSGSSIDGNVAITGVSCPSASLCVAVDDAGDVLTSTSPGSGGWHATNVDARGLRAVSCAPSPLSCVAVDDAGDVLASSEPTNGGSWHAQTVAFGELLGASCTSLASVVAGTPGVLCAAVEAGGDVLASEDPLASPATWNLTPIDLGQSFAAVSCASSGLCVAVDGHGRAIASDHPAGVSPGWVSTGIDNGRAIAGVACLAGGFCLAVDGAGHSLSARVRAPEATTVAPPTEVTSGSALAVGEVNPDDAVLAACTFEYGAAGAALFTQSVPCSATPAANGGSQRVSARLTGLAPNTAYRYRVVATSPAGTNAGGEVVFTTAASPLVTIVTPNPSIVGTPAVGQRLACHPGTPAGVTLGYVWLRDVLAIAGATGSTYTVTGQDSGHHLQCQVTASDAGGNATARSAFVTIPIGGVPASAGETTVGTAAFRGGRVGVPVTCSSRASGGCEVTVRLQASETLSGRRIVAVAARAAHRARAGRASVRHVTITLASARVHIAAGAHVTVSATLSAAAKRLLAARRRFSAYLYVSGTVIGVLEAQLAKQLLTLVAGSHSAAVHARRR
jgi:hypothetical protein